MNPEDLLRELMGTFLDELDEHVESLNRDALSLEQVQDVAQDRELIDTIFRTVHSLKGAARAVDIKGIETACHQLESIFDRVRDRTLPLHPAISQLLFDSADEFSLVSRSLRAGDPLDGAGLGALVTRLRAYPDGLSDGAATPVPSGMVDMRAAPPPPHRANTGQVSADEGFDGIEFETPSRPLVEGDSRALGSGASVRVPATKLDDLLTRSSELLLAFKRRDQLLSDMESLQESMYQWQRAVESQLGLASRIRDGNRAAGARKDKDLRVAVATIGEKTAHLVTEIDQLVTSAVRSFRVMATAAEGVNAEVHRLRLLPFGTACLGLHRAVRDLARARGKQVRLRIAGEDVEIDRSVLEGMKDPLLHLVRNAIEHGVERPEVRVAAGKSPEATVSVTASLRGAQVEVVVADDGAGLNLAAIREQITARGLRMPHYDRELTEVLFMPGFSTSQEVSRVSGRGVGLDVVKHQVEQLHGTIQVFNESKAGTRFVIALPLTITTIHVLLVRMADSIFAIPLTGIMGLLRIGAEDLSAIGSQQTISYQGQHIPLSSLRSVFGVEQPELAIDGRMPVVVVVADAGRVALIVDELIAAQDVVVTHLGPRIRRVRHITGGAILQSGQVALVVSIAEMVSATLHTGGSRVIAAGQKKAQMRILVADDSVTTRTLEKTILRSAGYHVRAAVDGAEAWDLLQRHGADLLVSDVEMPRMDGYTLAETVRRSARFRDLPIILLTSLDSELQRQRGLQAGANAFLIKSLFDQTELLNVIRQLL